MSIAADIQALGPITCLDLETAMAPLSFQGRDHVRLLQLLSDAGECWYDLQTFTPSDWEELKSALERPGVTWVGQNIGFDLRCLLGCGITLAGRLEDTMVQSALLNNGLPNVSNSLEAIAKRVLGQVIDKSLQKQDWMNATLNDADLAYAMGDVRLTWAAWQEQRAQIKTAGLQKVYDLECALIPAVVEMEHSGMLLDQTQAAAAIAQLEGEIEVSRGEFLELLDSQLRELAGFNINAPAQVLTKLNLLGIDPRDPKTGKPTTDKKVMRPLADNPVVYSLLGYKRAEKRRSMIQSWLDKNVEADGRIHARFAPLSTGTGRFSCSSPNCQQIPRESYIRDCFIAGEGNELVVMDVNAMELRVACSAPIADEKQMQAAFRDGADPLGIALTFDEASEFLRRWKAAYPGFANWHQWCARQADKGEVRMVDGRRRWLMGEMARPTVYANNQTQGTSASIVKLTMVNVHRRLPVGARLIAQIHDELIVEAPEGTGEEILDAMKKELYLAGQQLLGDSVEMVGSGSVAKSWGSAK
ncbi:MAG: DNA polymerase [Cyanobium sp. 49614_E6]|nr:DNA polymerase [Cyanobium sp. 49614_E6]